MVCTPDAADYRNRPEGQLGIAGKLVQARGDDGETRGDDEEARGDDGEA